MALRTLQLAFPEQEAPNGATLAFGFTNYRGESRYTSGVAAIEQYLSRLLLTRLGTNAFDPNEGTTLVAATQQRISDLNRLSLRNDITVSVSAAAQQILDSQTRLDLEPHETLLSIDVESADYSETLGWQVVVRIQMADGNVARSLLEL